MVRRQPLDHSSRAPAGTLVMHLLTVLRGSAAGLLPVALAVLTMWLVSGEGAVANAQGLSAGPNRDIRVDWALERTKRPLWTLCGNVYNDRPVSARHVELLVERLDASGSSASSRALHSITDVPAGGRSIFCLPVPAGSGPYRISVQAVDWGYQQAP